MVTEARPSRLTSRSYIWVHCALRPAASQPRVAPAASWPRFWWSPRGDTPGAALPDCSTVFRVNSFHFTGKAPLSWRTQLWCGLLRVGRFRSGKYSTCTPVDLNRLHSPYSTTTLGPGLLASPVRISPSTPETLEPHRMERLLILHGCHLIGLTRGKQVG